MIDKTSILLDIKQLIKNYLKGSIPLREFVPRLEELAYAHPSTDNQWVENFINYWFPLEEVNAVLLDDQRTNLNAQEELLINSCIKKITVLTDTELNKNLSTE